jgi:TPR repeat protein
VETDLKEASKWYEKSALAGNQNALMVWRTLNP